MSDVFISYAREDFDTVNLLAAALESFGWSTWWDQRMTASGPFSEKIKHELDQAKVVVVLWSRFSRNSDWVREEAEYGRSKLVPLSKDGVDPPFGFMTLNTVSIDGWNGGRNDAELTPMLRSIEAMAPLHADDRQGLIDHLPDRYRIEQTLDQMYAKMVFSATDKVLDREVAIYAYNDLVLSTRGKILVEARRMAQLSGHENLIAIFDVIETRASIYLVCELMKGGNLRHRLNELSVEESISITVCLASALQEIHKNGLVHRGLRPESVLFDDAMKPHLGGFGLMGLVDEAPSPRFLNYVAPETVSDKTSTMASDIYSLGATLYEMLTGRPPAQIGSLEQVGTLEVISPGEIKSEIPPVVDVLCMRLLALNPVAAPIFS